VIEHGTLDNLVRTRLKRWPQRPPGLKSQRGKDAWLRCRPPEVSNLVHPLLKLPGSNHWRTLPDGLWLNFGGTPEDPYVDVFAIEACSTTQNLLDKRSRFAPSTHSMLAYCPVPWLLGAVTETDPTPRWKVTGLFREQPTQAATLPVREIRVLYGLKNRDYAGFVRSQLAHAHEFFMPLETLTEENSDRNPALRALVKRASVTANFLCC
jgi:hypothetical protein